MIHRILLVITTSMIFSLGVVMIFNTTSAEVLDHALDKSTHQALIKQIIYACSGMILAIGAWRWGYKNIINYSPILLGLFILFLLLCFVPGIGKEVNGSRRWIGLFGFSLQPSEFIKYIVPAFFIYRLRPFTEKAITFCDFLKILSILAIPIVLILIEPNNGTAGVIALTLVALFVLASIPLRFWAIPLIVLFTLGSAAALSLPYVQARLKVYMNPELDLKGKGHQPRQAKIAAGSGQFFGKGIGNSLQKLSYLPEAQNDYIAAIYAEETGFVGTTLLISSYMMIAYLGFAIAYRAKTTEACYYAGVIAFLITFQAFMNLGVVSGLLPSTGLNLPFFSQGGSSLIANMAGIGILLNISWNGKSTEEYG